MYAVQEKRDGQWVDEWTTSYYPRAQAQYVETLGEVEGPVRLVKRLIINGEVVDTVIEKEEE